jgi:hypothetical protein
MLKHFLCQWYNILFFDHLSITRYNKFCQIQDLSFRGYVVCWCGPVSCISFVDIVCWCGQVSCLLLSKWFVHVVLFYGYLCSHVCKTRADSCLIGPQHTVQALSHGPFLSFPLCVCCPAHSRDELTVWICQFFDFWAGLTVCSSMSSS